MYLCCNLKLYSFHEQNYLLCTSVFTESVLSSGAWNSQVQNLVTYYGHVNSDWSICVHIWYIGVCCFVLEIQTPLLCCIGFSEHFFTNILNLFHFYCCTIILQLQWLHILDALLILGIPNGGIHGNGVWLTDTRGLCVCVWHPIVCCNMKHR